MKPYPLEVASVPRKGLPTGTKLLISLGAGGILAGFPRVPTAKRLELTTLDALGSGSASGILERAVSSS